MAEFDERATLHQSARRSQIEFEISDGVRVRQMRQMISGVRTKGEPAKEKAEAKDKAEKDETSAS